MKKLEKMSLANVRNKLTRKEMKNIMGGGSAMRCISSSRCSQGCLYLPVGEADAICSDCCIYA